MADQSLFQRGEQRHALLTQRGEIASDATKGKSTDQGTETARDLLLHFDHTDIALSQTIVKGHREIVQEGQDGILVLAEAIKQIAAADCLRRPFLATSGGGSGGLA